MRWPWQRDAGVPPVADPGTRASHPGAGVVAGAAPGAGPSAGASAGASAAPTAAATAADAPGARESTSGWAFLPPLQRTVRPVELTSRPVAFLADLPTRAALPFTGSMTHVVDHRAPSGVVDGDGDRSAPPVQRSADVDLTLLPPAPRAAAPVQRRTGGLVGLDSAPAGTPRLRAVPVDPPAPDVPTVTPAGPPADTPRGGDGWTADGWTAPGGTDAPASDGSWRDGDATTVPIGPPPPPPTVAPAAPAAPAVPARADGGAAVQRRVGLGAPISRSPLASAPPDLPLVPRDASTSAHAAGSPTAPADRRTAGSAPVAGEHLAAQPASGGDGDARPSAGATSAASAVQRSTDAPGGGRAEPGSTSAEVVQRSTSPSGGVPAVHVDAPAPTGAPPLDLVRPSSDGPSAASVGADGPVGRAGRDVDGSTTVAGAGPSTADASGDRGSSDDGTSAAHRAAGSGGASRASGGSPSTAGPSDASSPPPLGTSPATHRTVGDAPSVQRAVGDPRTPGGPGALTAPDSASASSRADTPGGSSAPAVRPAAPRPAPSSADALAVVQRRTDAGASTGDGAARATGDAAVPSTLLPATDAAVGQGAADAPGGRTAHGAAGGGETGSAPDGPGPSAGGSGARRTDATGTTDATSTSGTGAAVADAPLPAGAPASSSLLAATAPDASVPGSVPTLGDAAPLTTGPAPDGAGPTTGSGAGPAGGGAGPAVDLPLAAPATPVPPAAPAAPAADLTLATPPAHVQRSTGSPTGAGATYGPDRRVPSGGAQPLRGTTTSHEPGGTTTTPASGTSHGTPTTEGPTSAPTASATVVQRAVPGDHPTAPAAPAAPTAPAGSADTADTDGPAWTEPSPTAPPGGGAAVPLGAPRAAAAPDLPLVARSTAAPDATASAGPGATTGAGPAQALSVGPLLAGRPAPVQLADRPPTLLAGQVATRRAVPVQRAVPGAPAPASPRTGGATLTTPVLDRTRGGAASAVGAVASRRADGSTDPVPSHGADLAVALTGTSPARSTTHPDAADDSRPTDAPAVLPVPSATASPVDGALVTLQRTSAPGTSATTDRPLTPLSPGGAGAPVGPTVSRPSTPVRADASSADTTATGTTEVPGPLPLVQRRVEPTSTPPTLPPEPPAAPPTVQRSDDAAPPPPVATPVAAADAAGAAPEGSGASPFATATPADLDELARRLMTPLMRRVRGQLLVDRERRGTRIDR